MAVTLSVILTYLIVQYMPIKSHQCDKQVAIILPAGNALFIRPSDEEISYIVTNKMTPIARGTAHNALIIRNSEVDICHDTFVKKTKSIATNAPKKPSVWRFLKRRRSMRRNILRKSIVNLLLKTLQKPTKTVSMPSTSTNNRN